MATEDDSDIPETGAVFTFGKSRFADNSPNKFWIRNDKVVQVCCGDEHSILVAGSGRVFAFGCNDWGQLGLGHNRSMTKPGCVKSLKGEKITHAACGRQHTIVSAESGKLYAFGANGEGQLGIGNTDSSSSPKLLESIQPQVWTMLAAGTEHSVALSEDGIVYVWGCGDAGQLGLGDDQKEAHEPVELFLDEKVLFIAAGYYHTAMVTISGKLFICGENESGQLGIENVQNVFEPLEVSNISGKVVALGCGGGHTVVVTDKGKVYSYGNGENGQLGHGNTTMQLDKPVEMIFGKDKIKAVSCGENHTALITTKGQLYTCGDGRHGKLGLGEENFTNQFRPAQVQRFANFTVEQVSCGGCHMLVIAAIRVQNGDWESSEEDEGIDETDHALTATPNINHLRKSEDMDLTGSFSARNRRRIKQEPLGTLGRNLPELDGTLSRKSNLPPLSATAPISSSNSLENKETENPLNRSMLPPLKKEAPDLKSFDKTNGKHKDEDEDEDDEDSDEDEDEEEDMRKKRAAIKKQSADITASAPVPKPKPRPTKKEEKPVPASRQRKPMIKKQEEEEEEEDTEEDSEEEEEEEEKNKDLRKKKDKKVEKKEKTAKAKKKEESEEEDEEDSEEEEDEKNRKKEKEAKKEKDKKKEEKDKGKKKKGLFGKSKPETEDEDEDEEEEEEKDKKKKKSKEKDKGKEKEKDKKGKKKSKEEEEDDEEEEDEDEEADSEDEKDKKKKEEEKKKPEEKKKSRTCVIL